MQLEPTHYTHLLRLSLVLRLIIIILFLSLSYSLLFSDSLSNHSKAFLVCRTLGRLRLPLSRCAVSIYLWKEEEGEGVLQGSLWVTQYTHTQHMAFFFFLFWSSWTADNCVGRLFCLSLNQRSFGRTYFLYKWKELRVSRSLSLFIEQKSGKKRRKSRRIEIVFCVFKKFMAARKFIFRLKPQKIPT